MAKRPSKLVRDPQEAAYEVGYGRPPQATRFQKGHSGNPKGRPKGARTLADAFERDLDQTVTVMERGRPRTMIKRTLISRKVVDDACRGDHRAIRLLRDEERRKLAPSAEAGPSSTAAPPCDQTDRAILAAYRALIRSGAAMPDDLDDARDVPTIAAPDDDLAPSDAPTRH